MTADSRPVLSVVVISYNEAEYLPCAIESCISQTFKDFEITIGDDGSKDGSIPLIESYCSKYPGKISYFVMERPEDDSDIVPSIRVSNVIKTALKKARGEFIVCLSGDDYYCDNDKFSDAVNFLKCHDNYSAYVSDFKRVFPDGEEHVIQAADCTGNIFWGNQYIHLSSFVFPKFVFDRGYFLNRFCDDTGAIFSMACAGKWKFSHKVTFAYRKREGSIVSKSDSVELAICELMLFQDCLCMNRLKWSSYSRFSRPLGIIYRQRKQLHDGKYAKYLRSCDEYDHNIIREFVNYDVSIKSRILVWCMRVKGKMAHLLFKYVGKIYRAPSKLYKLYKKVLSR